MHFLGSHKHKKCRETLHKQFIAKVMAQVPAAIPIELLGIKGHIIKELQFVL